MNRQRLEQALARAIEAGRLTRAETLAFLAAVEAGEIGAGALPAAIAVVGSTTTTVVTQAIDRALVALLINMGLVRVGTRGTDASVFVPSRTSLGVAVRALRRMPHVRRESATIDLADGFAADAFRLAARVNGYNRPDFEPVGPSIGVRTWHRAFVRRIASEHAMEATLALGRPLGEADVRRIAARIAPEVAYADRFAAEVAARRHAGRPYSIKYMADRSRQYEGAARAVFYEWGERVYEQRNGAGFVFHVEGSDDNGTCDLCENGMDKAPYLAGRGFIPGRDCRGRGKCRHRRVAVYDVAEYDRLRRRAAKDVASGGAPLAV